MSFKISLLFLHLILNNLTESDFLFRAYEPNVDYLSGFAIEDLR